MLRADSTVDEPEGGKLDWSLSSLPVGDGWSALDSWEVRLTTNLSALLLAMRSVARVSLVSSLALGVALRLLYSQKARALGRCTLPSPSLVLPTTVVEAVLKIGEGGAMEGCGCEGPAAINTSDLLSLSYPGWAARLEVLGRSAVVAALAGGVYCWAA
jgi:hypothetical protein